MNVHRAVDEGVSGRVVGAMLAMAAGDALGAGYEFTTPGPEVDIAMIGGGIGNFAPGEWTDDTAQAVAIAQGLVGGTLDLAGIGRRFLDWFEEGPKDVGVSTAAVMRAARGDAGALSAAADHYFEENPGGAAGNGSLMRTAPVALAYLGDDQAIATAARAVSHLTHGDPLAAEACVLWCIAIDRAVREQRLDGARDGLRLLPPERALFWQVRLGEAEDRPPSTFTANGFVVTALQAAHSAIHHTAVPDDDPPAHLRSVLVAAVRIGNDTDTVAAIAGQLVGARWGASAVPDDWRKIVHGWPGLDGDDLRGLALAVAGM